MGYACPVCETPQRDAAHLANHLAFTAMLHGDDHEAWLDDEVPGWNEEGPEDLADRLEGLVDSADYEEVFEDTVHGEGGGHDHDHAHGRGRSPPQVADAGVADGEVDEETRRVLEEARAMTRRMYDEE